MEQLHLPQICCPFPASISHLLDDVHAHNMYWVQQFNLAPTPQLMAAYRQARFPWFVSRIYHTADYLELCLACDFCTWLFRVDDLLEQLGGNKRQHERVVQEMIRVLEHGQASVLSEQATLAAGLMDIWERMKALCPPGWQRRFIKNMKNLFDATCWEADNRFAAQPPGIAEYIKMRPYTSAMYPCIDLIEMMGQSWLPDEIRLHDAVQQLTLTCIEAVCWINDLVSFNKEQRINEPHNVVLLLQGEHRLSPYDAIREVTEVCNETIRHFQFLENKLLTGGKVVHKNLPHYTAGLRSWIRGNLDWSIFDTERYGVKVVKRDEEYLSFSKIFLEE
ncbi:Terpene synthase family, metal binding domain [Chitinophaga rupis]|uniref:Terpene synthase n=1 Tax=Chitinophaga rupis TaxID=573321 RepID=A0A1H8CYP5_9BACT|nr:hypothetical protein [Chitinophaga rupis]SEN00075.1 Terpene synthase family, metal binding domain [Chitinophaga rupis]